ncbi:hypothetical protein NEMBOFW57_006228 [Staphylotrichum longicolle]|uniref:Ferric reductase n=1 Tax=Staphylotrichum longicolle TaxID=669026 RepID=A0AAD4EYM8_9PEZI|nr:hypothetical protein NEMBOFW57_006228 [Staphylotrichum longicolle]
MAGLVWHVLLTQSVLHEVLIFVACGLWLLSHVYRVVTRWRSAEVRERWSDSEVTRLRLKTQRPVDAFPGRYCYLYLPGSYLNYNMLRSSAVMILWSDVKQTVTGKTTDFHILAGRQSRYETVILTAKGMGIVSALPMALHLAARKYYDDSVRSESNLFEDPTDLDPRQVMLLVWYIYPKPKTTDSPFRQALRWSAFYLREGESIAEAKAPFSFENALSHEVLMPGKCIVVACGDRAFTDERRASVIRNTSRDWPIEFVEAEYRPRHNED